MTDPDTARWNTMSRRAALLARAEENRPDDDHVPAPEDARDAALIFLGLYAFGWVLHELARAMGWLPAFLTGAGA